MSEDHAAADEPVVSAPGEEPASDVVPVISPIPPLSSIPPVSGLGDSGSGTPPTESKEDIGEGLTAGYFFLYLGLAVLISRYAEIPIRQMLLQFALPIFVITQLVRRGLHWLRQNHRVRRGVQAFQAKFGFGGGFYGVVASLTFLKLEYQALAALWRQTPDAWSFISELSFEKVFLFGLDSLTNAIAAALWPWQWFEEFGSETWKLLLLTWLIYRAMLLILKPVLPEPLPQPNLLGRLPEELDELDRELDKVDQQLSDLDRRIESDIATAFGDQRA